MPACLFQRPRSGFRLRPPPHTQKVAPFAALTEACLFSYACCQRPSLPCAWGEIFLRGASPTPAPESGPPAKPGACVSPEWAYCRQASQEALKKSAACIACPAARKRTLFVQDYPSGNRKVVHLFPLRPMLEAKAFLLSPALLGVVISLKHTRQKTLHSLK